MNKFLVLLFMSTWVLAQGQNDTSTTTTATTKPSLKISESTSVESNAGCAAPSASAAGPIALEPGVVGGPKEERNNPRSMVYPAPGCKVEFPSKPK